MFNAEEGFRNVSYVQRKAFEFCNQEYLVYSRFSNASDFSLFAKYAMQISNVVVNCTFTLLNVACVSRTHRPIMDNASVCTEFKELFVTVFTGDSTSVKRMCHRIIIDLVLETQGSNLSVAPYSTH